MAKRKSSNLRTVAATRYLTPLREGGSLPAIVEGDDKELYVLKFAGTGHGTKALIAELLGGEIGRALGLRVPEIVFVTLDESIGRSEPNAEIRDLLRWSVGLNLGLRYLPKAFGYNQLLKSHPSAKLASDIVWFDSYIANMDRTAQNVNLLVWQGDIWLIDHGSALYFHHRWSDISKQSRSPFPMIEKHTLLPFATDLQGADARAKIRLSNGLIQDIVSSLPDDWLQDKHFQSPQAQRNVYTSFLRDRLAASSIFVEEAERARAKVL